MKNRFLHKNKRRIHRQTIIIFDFNSVKIYRYVSFEFWAKLVKDSKFATFKQSSLSCLSVKHFSVLAAEK